MGIFEDEARAMIQEEKEEIHKQAALEQMQREVAQNIRDDLLSYVNASQRSNIELSAENNHVHVRLRASSSTLDIICEGANAFKVFDVAIGRVTTGALDKKVMARQVLQWLKRPQ